MGLLSHARMTVINSRSTFNGPISVLVMSYTEILESTRFNYPCSSVAMEDIIYVRIFVQSEEGIEMAF